MYLCEPLCLLFGKVLLKSKVCVGKASSASSVVLQFKRAEIPNLNNLGGWSVVLGWDLWPVIQEGQLHCISNFLWTRDLWCLYLCAVPIAKVFIEVHGDRYISTHKIGESGPFLCFWGAKTKTLFNPNWNAMQCSLRAEYSCRVSQSL